MWGRWSGWGRSIKDTLSRRSDELLQRLHPKLRRVKRRLRVLRVHFDKCIVDELRDGNVAEPTLPENSGQALGGDDVPGRRVR